MTTSSRPQPPQSTPNRRNRRAGCLLLAGSLLFTFGLCEIVVRSMTQVLPSGMPRIARFTLLPFKPEPAMLAQWRARKHGSQNTYVIADAELGWCVGKSGSSELGSSNAQGIRCAPERTFTADPPPDVTRICAFGDSFTHCDEVGLAESWPHRLELLLEKHEVMNFGVPGYGTDQAFLRWRREMRNFRAHRTLLGIWPEDLCRNVSLNRFYWAPAGDIACKPRFVLADAGDPRALSTPSAPSAELQLHGFPVPDDAQIIAQMQLPEPSALWRHDFWYRADEQRSPWWYESRLLRLIATLRNEQQRQTQRQSIYDGSDPIPTAVTLAIAQRFAAEAKALGQTPTVMLIPMRELLFSYPGGARALPLVKQLRAVGLEVWDHSEAMAAAAQRETLAKYYLPSGHLTADGNALLADEIRKRLR